MKIKMKKSLMLTALASVASVTALTPVVTMTACGDPAALTLNKELSANWTEEELVSKINAYDQQIQSKTSSELVAEFNDLVAQLIAANTLAYSGFDKIATYTKINFIPPTEVGKNPTITGGWTLNANVTLQNAYDFFVSRSTNTIYPSYDYFEKNRPSSPLTDEQFNAIVITFLEFPYAYLVETFAYVKVVKIAKQLMLKKQEFNDIMSKDNLFATNLYTMYLNVSSFYGLFGSIFGIPDITINAAGDTSAPWDIPQVTDIANDFLNSYKNMGWTITNSELESQTQSKSIAYGFDFNTGYVLLSFHTSQESTVKQNTNI